MGTYINIDSGVSLFPLNLTNILLKNNEKSRVKNRKTHCEP